MIKAGRIGRAFYIRFGYVGVIVVLPAVRFWRYSG